MTSFGFHPRLWTTLLTLGLIALFVSLGQWQLGKAQVKEAAQARLDAGRGEAPLALGAAIVADPAALHLKPVAARGRYDAGGQILIDNRVLHERAGFHVLTPLVIDDGAGAGTRVLVNRGWIAAPPSRAQALDPNVIAVPAGPLTVTGTAIRPSTKIFALAPDTAPAGGDAIWQNLDLARYRDASRQPVQPIVILLAPETPHGFVRDWPRPDDRYEKHLSYAYQWYGFAATSFAIWAYFAFRREARRGDPSPTIGDADVTPSRS